MGGHYFSLVARVSDTQSCSASPFSDVIATRYLLPCGLRVCIVEVSIVPVSTYLQRTCDCYLLQCCCFRILAPCFVCHDRVYGYYTTLNDHYGPTVLTQLAIDNDAKELPADFVDGIYDG